MQEQLRRRLLLAARQHEADALGELFTCAPLNQWETLQADSFLQMRFLLQHTGCEVALVDEGLCCLEGWEDLSWLARQENLPIVFLGERAPETFALAYQQGAHICLPRDWTMSYPPLLAAALDRALIQRKMLKDEQKTKDRLKQSRRQIDRLVGLIWRMSPAEPEQQFFPQRHILDRLQEEMARCNRHGIPLTIAIGQTQGAGDKENAAVPEWTTDVVLRSKRRCDVVGQYGLQGFLLMLVHTPEEGGLVCCRRLVKKLLEAHPPIAGPHEPVRTVFGLASLSTETQTPQALLRKAEENLEKERQEALACFVGEDCL